MSRTGRVALVLLAPPLLFLGLAWGVFSWAHIDVPARLGADARQAITSYLRLAASSDAAELSQAPGLQSRLDEQGPVIVGAWAKGKEVARVEGRGQTVADAIVDAGRALRESGLASRLDLREVRLKVDVVAGRGPLADPHPLVRAIALHPGVDGLAVSLPDGRSTYFLPDDLVSHNLLQAGSPLKHVDFKLGVAFEAVKGRAARRFRMKAKQLSDDADWFRFRVDSFVEGRRAESWNPIPLTRGLPPRPELSAEALRRAAVRGGQYLVAHLSSSGRYVYAVELPSGRSTNPDRPGPYSIPRHAGTTYFLAELYRLTGEDFLREPMARAFSHLRELVVRGGCSGTLASGAEFACVVDRGKKDTELGSTALTVVALVEYQRATGNDTYMDLARKLSEFILDMQRPDGSFTHRYIVPERRRDESAYLLYYSGEAALALARMYEVTSDERYIRAAERALDHLVGFYDFFLGGFFYGEDHWTCIAAEAALPALKKESYRTFCNGYGSFLRAQQVELGDFPGQDDLAGSYMFTPFAMPQNTPTGSRTESMISAYLLGDGMGRGDRRLLGQIWAAMDYSLGQQIRPEFDWFVSPKAVGQGAISTTPSDRRVRIDYVQHVCSAMIRAAVLIESL